MLCARSIKPLEGSRWRLRRMRAGGSPQSNGYGNSVSLKYQSGEEIRKGDSVRFHGEPVRIELAAVEPGDVETDWFVQEYGGGVMVLDRVAGRTFIPADRVPDCEDLVFVARATTHE
jgi:hypothetical protein